MAGALDDIRDVRQRAAAILSGRELQMLEDQGQAVIERSELDRYRKVEAAAREICGNCQMGRPNYWELYKDPPDELLKLHDALYQDVSDGREWALVDKRRLEGLERLAKAAKKYRAAEIHAHPLVPDEDWDYNDSMNTLGEAEREFDAALAALEAMERG